MEYELFIYYFRSKYLSLSSIPAPVCMFWEDSIALFSLALNIVKGQQII